MAKYFNVTPSTCWEWNSMKFTHRRFNEVYLNIRKSTFFLESSSEGTLLSGRVIKYLRIFFSLIK